MNIHFIQHDHWVEPGEYGAWAERRGFQTSRTRVFLYEELPASAEADMLVVLGVCMCPATTKTECDYFDAEAEKRLIRQYVEAGKPVVGVCLGSQLLGEAMGAPYGHSPEREVGPVPARLTEAGRQDPLFEGFPDAFFAGEWHNDMPGLTPECVIIAESEGCPRQIVRYGKGLYGFQTHMEFNHEIVKNGLLAMGEEEYEKDRAGHRFMQSPEELLSFDYTEMNAMLAGFLDRLVAKEKK